VRTAFPLVKTYWDAAGSYERRVTKPVAASVKVAINAVALTQADFSVDGEGVVTLNDAAADGALVTAGFQFDVPVRFDTDRLSIDLTAFRAGEAPSIPLVEILT